MNALAILGVVAKYAVSASVGGVVGNLVAVKTPPNAKPITKISIGIGTFVLSGLLSDMAMTYVETQAVEMLTEIVRTRELVKAEMNKTGGEG
jgi:hypothetical protein